MARASNRQRLAGAKLNVQAQALHRSLFGILNRLGIVEDQYREPRLTLCSDVLGYPINTTSRLPKAEVERLIDGLNALMFELKVLGLNDLHSRGDFLLWGIGEGIPFTRARVSGKVGLGPDIERWRLERAKIEGTLGTLLPPQ